MSSRIVALRIRKQLADWLHTHCVNFHILTEAEGEALRSQLVEARLAWNGAIAYDVKGIDSQDAAGAIVSILRQLEVSTVVVCMGEYEAPLVAEVDLTALGQILERIVATEEVLSIVGLGLIGESLVDFTRHEDGYGVTVSGAGRFIEMPTLIQQRFPGGEIYREQLS